MRQIKYALLGTLFAMFVVGGIVSAQTATHTHCQRITFSAAATPVAIMPSVANQAGMLINEEAADTVNVLAWPYTGNVVPTAIPSACASPTASLNDGIGCIEITPTKGYSEATVCDAPNCNVSGDPWAAVVETAGTVTLDTCYRAPF